jgi:hypothetical protein
MAICAAVMGLGFLGLYTTDDKKRATTNEKSTATTSPDNDIKKLFPPSFQYTSTSPNPDIPSTPPNNVTDAVQFVGYYWRVVDNKVVLAANLNGNTLELLTFVKSGDAQRFVDRICQTFRDNMEQDEPAMRVSVYHSMTHQWMAECHVVRQEPRQ